jgi:hypothetical protein
MKPFQILILTIFIFITSIFTNYIQKYMSIQDECVLSCEAQHNNTLKKDQIKCICEGEHVIFNGK